MDEQESNNQKPQQQNQESKQGNKALKIILIVVGAFLVLGALGTFLLFQFGENIFEEVTNTEFETSEEGVKIESEQGTFEAQADMPDDFPEAVPLFEDGEVISSSTISDNEDGLTTYTVSFGADAATSEVADYYESTLEDEGWEINQTSSFNEMRQISAERDNLSLTVVVNADSTDDFETSYTLSVRESQATE